MGYDSSFIGPTILIGHVSGSASFDIAGRYSLAVYTAASVRCWVTKLLTALGTWTLGIWSR